MKTILIVDDQDRIRRTYSRVFKREGYRVLESANADSANEMLKKERIDLMLLDINMPQADGSVLYEIASHFHQGVKVIVSSVYPLEDQSSMIPDADDYFDKSEGIKALVEKVNYQFHPGLGKNVVIIDDEPKIRLMYTHLLRKEGFETLGFGDNKLALRFLKSAVCRIDLLVLDLAMPAIDGCHFFEMMKLRHPHTKILVASNYPLDTQRFLIFDADDYFDKSEGNAAFLDKVAQLIGEPK